MSPFLKTLGTVTGAALIASPTLLLAPAASATQTCKQGSANATVVAPGICEVAFTTAGDFSYTPPAGIIKLGEIIIGGGGGANFNGEGSYGGGGGEVLYNNATTDFTTPITFHVAEGGLGSVEGSEATIGGDSTLGMITARGGRTSGYDGSIAYFYATSGNENDAYINDEIGSGGGAGGDALSLYVGGVGLTAAQIGDGDSLTPVYSGAPSFGVGGYAYNGSTLTSGQYPVTPGSGGSVLESGSFTNGKDGAVFFRYEADGTATLPNTGSNTGLAAAEGIAAIAAGTALVAVSRRRKSA